MSAGDPFGSVVARYLGLTKAPALLARPAKHTQLEVSWLSCGSEDIGHTARIPPEDSFVVMLHLADYKYPELWQHRTRPILAPCYPKDSISIVNLHDELSANIGCPLEALSFYIPRATLNNFTEEAFGTRVAELSCPPAIIDPVLANLGAALLPAFGKPPDVGSLFVDHLSLAFQAHVVSSYGGIRHRVRRTGGLTRRQEMRAKDYLVETPSHDVSIAGAAAICKLSQSHFIRAFKQTTGLTPHRWLLEHRVNKAKELLRHSLPLAAVATDCGFADQSHFTRIFTSIMGMPPGVWRRQCNG
jgi:AraC family transcriptional regulator